jgi:hypothetical protein
MSALRSRGGGIEVRRGGHDELAAAVAAGLAADLAGVDLDAEGVGAGSADVRPRARSTSDSKVLGWS